MMIQKSFEQKFAFGSLKMVDKSDTWNEKMLKNLTYGLLNYFYQSL